MKLSEGVLIVCIIMIRIILLIKNHCFGTVVFFRSRINGMYFKIYIRQFNLAATISYNRKYVIMHLILSFQKTFNLHVLNRQVIS